MTLISDDGYDVVVENYALVGVTGPTMNISGADENFANLTDSSTVFVNNDSSANTTVIIIRLSKLPPELTRILLAYQAL